MGCNCGNTERQKKDVMREKAIRFAVHMGVDVQFHTWTQRGFSRLYDYEEKDSVDRGKGVIEIIKFRVHKSKNVLSGSKKSESGSKKSAKSIGDKPGGTSNRNKTVKRSVGKNDEPIGGNKPRASKK